MGYFQDIETISTLPHLDGITTLVIDDSGMLPVLFAGSQIDGTISSFTLAASYTALVDQMTGGPERGTWGLSDLDLLTSPSGERLLAPSGRFDDAMALYNLPSDGTLGTRHTPAEAPGMVQSACARGHHPDGPTANHALTFNMDHSSGAAQRKSLTSILRSRRKPPPAYIGNNCACRSPKRPKPSPISDYAPLPKPKVH